VTNQIIRTVERLQERDVKMSCHTENSSDRREILRLAIRHVKG